MENGQNEAANALPAKKELKHQLADKMEAALPELKAILGDKKFANRIKKAAKLLIEGVYKKSADKKEEQPVTKVAAKKNTKGATSKKTAAATTAPKKAKAATARKAKAALKKSAGK